MDLQLSHIKLATARWLLSNEETEMRRPNGYWTLERLQADALQYQTRSAWKKGSGSAYQCASDKGFLGECCGHMVPGKKKWTLEQLQEDALQYQSRSAWEKGSRRAYCAAVDKGLLGECCGHMVSGIKKKYWTLERLQGDALQYQTRSAWAEGSPGPYSAARKQGILEECCGHMERLQKPNGYWTLERLQADALQYQMRGDWKKASSSGYVFAREQGLLDECCGHMDELLKPRGYWTLERLQEDALQYQTRKAWHRGSGSAYQLAFKQGLLEECCGHMGDRQHRCTDNDTVYFWKAEGTEFYKIGVTSERLGMQRINDVANASGFTPVLLAMTTINGKATDVETELLRKFDRSAGLEGFDGSTEFRHLASWEAAEIMETLANAGS